MLTAGTARALASAAGTVEGPKFQILKNPKGYQAVPYMDNSGHTYHRLKPGQCLSQAAAAPGSQEGKCAIFTPKFISFLVLFSPFNPRHPCPLQEHGGRATHPRQPKSHYIYPHRYFMHFVSSSCYALHHNPLTSALLRSDRQPNFGHEPYSPGCF